VITSENSLLTICTQRQPQQNSLSPLIDLSNHALIRSDGENENLIKQELINIHKPLQGGFPSFLVVLLLGFLTLHIHAKSNFCKNAA